MNLSVLAQALAMRTEAVLKNEDDPRHTMREVEAGAHSAGLLLGTVDLSMESPEEFSEELWLNNPLAHDWINLKRESIKNPLAVRDLSDLMDVLGATDATELLE